MFSFVKRLARAAYAKSPKENLSNLARKLKNVARPVETRTLPSEYNQLLSDFWNKPVYAKLATYRLNSFKHIFLLGNEKEIDFFLPAIEKYASKVTAIRWEWGDQNELPPTSENCCLIFCKLPLNDSQWRQTATIRARYGSRFVGLSELVLPFTVTEKLVSVLPYFKNSLEEIAPWYLGQEFFGPLDRLNEAFPIHGKSVIEFGPLDGYQTAGLVHLGARSVTCIEARAENSIKTSMACFAFNWKHVTVLMDDFHNVDRAKYGEFDLALAHGVYYHSISPFLFFENLLSLSKHIFLGGFCATDSNPAGEFETLEDQGARYRAKRYEEVNEYTAGVNRFGYFLHGDDLIDYFLRKGCKIVKIGDEETSSETAGRYLRILISRD
jgi:hypothetical protein